MIEKVLWKLILIWYENSYDNVYERFWPSDICGFDKPYLVNTLPSLLYVLLNIDVLILITTLLPLLRKRDDSNCHRQSTISKWWDHTLKIITNLRLSWIRCASRRSGVWDSLSHKEGRAWGILEVNSLYHQKRLVNYGPHRLFTFNILFIPFCGLTLSHNFNQTY